MSVSYLSALPPELAGLIVRELTINSDVAAVCLTSTRLYDVGSRVLYDFPVAAGLRRMISLLRTIVNKPELAQYVKRFTFDFLFQVPNLPKRIFPSFLRLATRALRSMSNLTELYAKLLPHLPVVLDRYVFPSLTHGSFAITKTAIPFLEANAATIIDLELADADDDIDEPDRELGPEHRVFFPRLARADMPLDIAPLFLMGTSTSAVTIHLPYPASVQGLEADYLALCLDEVPISTLKISSVAPGMHIFRAIVENAPGLHSLVIETILQPEIPRPGLLRTLERYISEFTNLKGLVIAGRPGIFRPIEPEYGDINDLAALVARMHKHCKTLELINLGFGVFWTQTGGVWMPRTLDAAPAGSKLHNTLTKWAMERCASDPGLMATLVAIARQQFPTQIREIYQEHGISEGDAQEAFRMLDNEDDGEDSGRESDWATDEGSANSGDEN
ncbi:hypothetical protein BD626DRAFT_629613 [Schizophyllum amplum]|uniref:F-box domain-containing protein n=1 Tax=Schizophyllum amplum TaxID=97359 RepID=A0A550CG94_9AGAR|nr:hypothetical protein BD626DRAFT_629613 [Auriculariopsis ampla]